MAEPPSPESPGPAGNGSARTPLDVLVERLQLPAGWVSRVSHLLLLLTVSVAAAFLVSPGLYSQQIPSLTQEDLGKPFRSSSPSGFKARRDYEVLDQATTEQRRQEAWASVRTVYDYDPSVQRAITKGLSDSFGQMQEVAAQLEAEKAAEKGGPPRPQTTEDALLTSKRKREEAQKEREEQELLHRLKEARRRFDPHALLEEEDFQALAGGHFSQEVEKAASTLIESAYRSRIASAREELWRVDPGGQGITVRVVGGSGEPQLSTSASPAVMDLREAQAELERYASVPGNLLPEAPPMQRRAVLRLAKRLIRPNLTINIAETEERRRAAAEAVKPAIIGIKKGQKVIGDGELINETHLVVLGSMRSQTDQLDLVQLELGGTGLVALLIAACFLFHRASFRRFRPTRKDALLLCTLLIGMLGLMHLWVTVADAVHDRYGNIPLEALYYFIPVAAGAMLVRFVLNQELALFFAIIFSSLAGVMIGNSLAFAIFALVGSLVASDRIARAKDRAGIFKAGVVTGLAQLCAVLFFTLGEGKGVSLDMVVTASFAFLGSAVAVPAMVMAITPLVEMVFGYASDIKLLELANLNHPALKELIVQAPGTYHHSIIMGSLVEAAAEVIGANPLLARSCAYYHDIGKGRNPLYFGENQKGENRHDSLAPAMSAVIIRRHVTEGLEMARQYKLPRLVADAISQHHGTRLVAYFHHKALKEQEGKESAPPVDDVVYRYGGPKPQFREAALVMIADAVEAAARSMTELTAPKLQALVQKMINNIFSEGQLDECDLTLRDLNLIAHSFVRTLEGIYHARPVYPPGAVAAAGGRAGPLSLAKPESKRSAGA